MQANDGNDHGLGNAVVIHHPDRDIYTLYGHLASFDDGEDGIEVGKEVFIGEVLGKMGGTANGKADAFPAHLHFEVKTHSGPGSSSGHDFGYIPSLGSATLLSHPNVHGFLDPWAYITSTSIAPMPVEITNADGLYIRRGPKSPDYSAFTEVTTGQRGCRLCKVCRRR